MTGEDTQNWTASLKAALAEPTPPSGPVGEDAQKRAERFVKRGKEIMGSGIDPAAVLSSLEGFREAIQADPTCLEAYLGLGRAAQYLAHKRPTEGVALLESTLQWLVKSSSEVGKLQESPEIHQLEFRLRDLRREARGRPKAEGQAVRVQLDRDDEGRVITQRKPGVRFSPDSGELRALIPGLPVPPDPDGQRLPRWIPVAAALLLLLGCANVYFAKWPAVLSGLVIGAGVVILSLPLLVLSGRLTKGIAPGVLTVFAFAFSVGLADHLQPASDAPSAVEQVFCERLGPLLDSWKPILKVGAPKRPEWKLSKLAVVEETGLRDAPLRTDPLHARLPKDLRANSGEEVRYVVLIRRLRGKGYHLVLAWAIEPNDRRVLAQNAFMGISPRVLDNDALEWIQRLR